MLRLSPAALELAKRFAEASALVRLMGRRGLKGKCPGCGRAPEPFRIFCARCQGIADAKIGAERP